MGKVTRGRLRAEGNIEKARNSTPGRLGWQRQAHTEATEIRLGPARGVDALGATDVHRTETWLSCSLVVFRLFY